MDWTPEDSARAFKKAYCLSEPGDPSSTFEDVVQWLDQGLSVLVYLPGNCMVPAADYVDRTGDWEEFGRHPGGNADITQVWSKSTGIFSQVLGWLGGGGDASPHGIYMNLDLLADGRGGLYGHPSALTVAFSLAEATRTGVVLGLADRDAGRLPAILERSFSEIVTIREIDPAGIRRLMPAELCRRLARGGTVPSSAVAELAGRLRSCDPVRAVRLMQAASDQAAELTDILDRLTKLTRPAGYDLLPDPTDREDELFKCFDAVTLDRIDREVIRPWSVRDLGSSVAPEIRERLRRRRPGAVILYGPPGTGKTTLARRIARGTGLPIKVASAAEIKDPLYGNAERNVHALFRDARRAAPSVLVLDDADDLFPARDKLSGSLAGADTGVVNAALQELEGFFGRLEDVLVILTTNQFDSLDKAVRDRLGLHVKVPYPLDEKQVGSIIDHVALDYGLDLGAKGVRDRLVQHFFEYAEEPPEGRRAIDTPDSRRACDEHLYSPRMIVKAMAQLFGPDADPIETYRVTGADVDRLKGQGKPHANEI